MVGRRLKNSQGFEQEQDYYYCQQGEDDVVGPGQHDLVTTIASCRGSADTLAAVVAVSFTFGFHPSEDPFEQW